MIKRLHNDLIHGMQQHPQVTSIATKTAIETKMDSISAFHLPSALSSHCPTGLSIPECSFISILSDTCPSLVIS